MPEIPEVPDRLRGSGTIQPRLAPPCGRARHPTAVKLCTSYHRLYSVPASIVPSRWRSLVARYDKEHKQVTRQRILDTAGRRFKTDGIDGSGVATLMADAGLTNGA